MGQFMHEYVGLFSKHLLYREKFIFFLMLKILIAKFSVVLKILQVKNSLKVRRNKGELPVYSTSAP